jgi:putative hemolysin
MKRAVKAPYYIPESMKANAILKSMKQKRIYFAVVIDEYGGMSGIVTVTDLLQCIVGEIFDEEDGNPQPDIEPLDSKTWMIRGSATISDVENVLGVSIEGDYGTFAGYVLTMVGSIPDDGVVFTVENDLMTVRVTAIKDRRIERTMVQLKEAKEND